MLRAVPIFAAGILNFEPLQSASLLWRQAILNRGIRRHFLLCSEFFDLNTKRKPISVGEILVEEFMQPMGLTQAALAEAMGVQRKHLDELCNDRRNVTAATALILARVFGNSPDFWLNVQRRNDLWEAMHSPRERKRIQRARPLTAAA